MSLVQLDTKGLHLCRVLAQLVAWETARMAVVDLDLSAKAIQFGLLDYQVLHFISSCVQANARGLRLHQMLAEPVAGEAAEMAAAQGRSRVG